LIRNREDLMVSKRKMDVIEANREARIRLDEMINEEQTIG